MPIAAPSSSSYGLTAGESPVWSEFFSCRNWLVYYENMRVCPTPGTAPKLWTILGTCSRARSERCKYRHRFESASDRNLSARPSCVFLYSNSIMARVLVPPTASSGATISSSSASDFHQTIRGFYPAIFSIRQPVTYYEFPTGTGIGPELWIANGWPDRLAIHVAVVGLQACGARHHRPKAARRLSCGSQTNARVRHWPDGSARFPTRSYRHLRLRRSPHWLARPLRHRTGDATDPKSRPIKPPAHLPVLTFSRRDVFRPRDINLNAVQSPIFAHARPILGKRRLWRPKALPATRSLPTLAK